MNTKKIFNLSIMFCLIFMIFSPIAKASAQEIPAMIFVDNLPTNVFSVNYLPVGSEVTATLDDPSTPGDSDYVLVQVVDQAGVANFQLPAGVFLNPLWKIKAIDGGITIDFTLPDIRITSIDLENNNIIGTIQPVIYPFALYLSNHFPGMGCDQGDNTLVDNAGNWTVHYPDSCDLDYGSWGTLFYMDFSKGIGVLTREWHAPTWTLIGFYKPVDMNGVYNITKGGSAEPLKFEIFAGPTELTDVSSIQIIIQYEINCITGEFINDGWTILTAGDKLVYDPTGGQFIYRWRVPKSVGKCYQVTMVMQEYSTLTVNFKVK